MQKYSSVVIGGGAAGICAAISKARRGESVILCEKTDRIGKKLLATGNGRCNLSNDDLHESHYNTAARGLVKSVFAVFGKQDIIYFFSDLGLETCSDGGRIFPRTNQAASVLRVLEMELQRLAVPIEFLFDFSGISFNRDRMIVLSAAGKSLECHSVIITGGGATYPLTGSDGSIYQKLQRLGYTTSEPVPAAVPLVVKDNLCGQLQGQRIQARVRSIIEGKAGSEVPGELLFTKYGLSGTCILDISESISIALNRYHKRDIAVSVDLVPFIDEARLTTELVKRANRNIPAADMLVGLLPNKISVAMKELFLKNDIPEVVKALKNRLFKVWDTRGWDEAEFTAGGIVVHEVKEGTLESRLHRGVYFAGEVLDVNGERGGYNLAWAWASGVTAGRTL